MARNTVTLTITLDLQQAKNKLEELKTELASVKEAIRSTQEKLDNPDLWGPEDTFKKLNKELKALRAEAKTLNNEIIAGGHALRGVDEQLKYVSDANYNELTKLRTSLTNTLKNMEVGTKSYREAAERLQKVRDEIAKRDVDVRGSMTEGRAKEVMKSLDTSSYSDIKNATETVRKLQQQVVPGSTAWKNYGKQIADATNMLEKWDNQVKRTKMIQLSKADLGKTSDSDLQQQIRYWDGIVNGIGRTNVALNQYKTILDRLQAEQTKRGERAVSQVLDKGQMGGSISEMQQRLKQLQDYRATIDSTKPDAFVRVDEAISRINQKIKEAQPGFLSYNEALQQAKSVGTGMFQGSIADLDKMKRTLEEYKGSLKTTDASKLKEVETAIADISQKQKELQAGYVSYVQAMQDGKKVMDGTFDGSLADLEKMQKALTEYRTTLNIKDTAGLQAVDQRLEAINTKMQQLRPGFMSFQDAMTKANAVGTGAFDGTLEDLEKLKKALQEGMQAEFNISDPNDVKQLQEVQILLESIAAKQKEMAQLNLKDKATTTMSQVETGSWDGTIGQTQEAIKQLQEYRNTLKTTDAKGLQRVDEAIERLNQKIREATQGTLSLKDALSKANNLKNFNGTIEDLEKLKKRLEEIRQKEIVLNTSNAQKKIKDIDEAIGKVNARIAGAKGGVSDFNKFIKDIDGKSLDELEKAASQLEAELRHVSRNTNEFVEKSAQLRQVGTAIDEVKKKMKEHDNVIAKTTKRLASYVAVYGGFNAIIGKMREMINANLQLSDSMADVQKTTGLTGMELQELGRELERIDTRTPTTELYKLAAAAGQIGLKTQEDVLGFAKAANTISVALNELGSEGSASLMKIATLTGEVTRYGTEGALIKVGSAINELTANSAATAEPISNFIARIGGIASASKMSIADMAALGAAADASGQSIEIAGTSMNKLITALLSNTENIAYAANISVTELQGLINQGETMQAVIRVFEAMQSMDRGAISGVMTELGSEGARMNQFVASMVANLDLLKRQIRISNEAFDEGTSVINEYNVKQESALGILQRMKNAFMDTFVNSKMAVVLKNILGFIADIPGWLEKNRWALFAVRLVITEIIALKIPLLLHTLMKGLSGMYELLSGPVIGAVKGFGIVWKNARYEVYMAARQTGASVAAATAATKGFTGVLRTLWAVIKANPVGLFLSLIGAAAAAIWQMVDKADKLGEAMAELTQKHARQVEELNALRAAIEATNTSYNTKAEAMREINSLYGKYLGFELSELDTYEKKKAALDYINAKLKENQTLEMVTRQKEIYQETFFEDVKKYNEGLTKALMAVPEIGAKRLTEAMNVINEAVKNGAQTSEEVIDELEKHFNITLYWKRDALEDDSNLIKVIESWIFGPEAFRSLTEYVKEYKELNDQLIGTDEYFSEQKIKNQEESDKALEELAEAHQNKIEAMTKAHQNRLAELEANGQEMTEAEQVTHLKNLLKETEEYQKTAEKLRDRAIEEDKKFIAQSTDKETGLVDEETMMSRYGGDAKGEAIRRQILELNKIRQETMAQIKAEQAANDKTLSDAEKQYELERQKENNEEQIQIAEELAESLKKKRNDLNSDLIAAELKWNDEYNELQTMAASETSARWTETFTDLGTKIGTLKTQIAGDPWGKVFNLKDWKEFPKLIEGLEDASVTSLVEGFKKLRDSTKLITKDVEGFNKMFELKTPLKDLDEVNTQVFDWLNQIRQELKRRNRGITGEMLWGNAKEETELVLKTIQTYFLKRQAQIRKSYIDGMVTGEEMKRRMDANNEEMLNARIEFRKMMLGQQSSFSEMFIPGLEDHDLVKLRTEIRILGDEVTEELENALADDENTMAEGAVKMKEAFEKELTGNDPFGTLRESFRSSLDALKLMSSEYEREIINDLRAKFPELNDDELGGLTEEKMQKRLDFLIECAQKSYTVDAAGLRKMFDSHQEYYAWVDKLDDTQMNVLLNKLQWFYDESLVKQDAYKNRLLKGLESSYLQQEEKMSEAAKIQWKLAKAKSERQNLIDQNEAFENATGITPIDKKTFESNKQEIIARNEVIKKLEEDLQKELEKDKNDRDKRQRENERKAKEGMEASISALEAYYNEREAIIRQKALESEASQATLDRELRKNTIAREKDLQELRKKLLGDKSEFDPTKNNGYKGAITGHVFFGTDAAVEEQKLQKQAQQIKTWGKALTDGMRNQIAKGEITIQEALQKQKEKIEKILLEDDFSEKVMHEYMEAIDELGLLFNVNESLEESDKQTSEARLAIMRDWAKESYNLTVQTLEDKIRQNELFNEWVENREPEHYEALLIQLRKFHDDLIEADKKAAERRKKIADARFKMTGQQGEAEGRIKSSEEKLELAKQLENFGVGGEQVVNDLEIEVLKEKIAYEQQWLALLAQEAKVKQEQLEKDIANKERLLAMEEDVNERERLNNELNALRQELASEQNQYTLASTEAINKMLDYQKQAADVYTEQFTGYFDTLKEYQGHIDTFAQSMGEGIFGSKEDRQQAAKDLLASVLTTSKNVIQTWLTQLATRRLIDELEVKQVEATEMRKRAIKLQSMIQDGTIAITGLTVDAAKAEAQTLLDSAAATGREVAKKGWIGLAIGAAISAALSALLGAALGKVNQAKSEIASETGASTGRLATGMLTYAEGNYPVLGNDGQVYNAKYEGSNIQTGIYRGGAHFGIFSEKKPEAIIDGDTTQRLIMNHPDIWKAIVTLSKTGRLDRGMPTFASGNIDQLTKQMQQTEAAATAATGVEMTQMQATMAATQQTLAQLTQLLAGGIKANINMYGDGGMYKNMKKAEKFASSRKYK